MTSKQWRAIWREFDKTATCPYCGHGVSDDPTEWVAIKLLVTHLVENQLSRKARGKKPKH